MDYDFNRTRSGASPYDAPYSRTASATSSSMYGPPSSMYPRVGGTVPPPVGRFSSLHHHTSSAPPPPSSSSSSPGLGIRVTLKPEFRITPPPQLAPLVGEIPRSSIHFDFDLERKILAEAEKENPNWSKFGFETPPSKPVEPTPAMGPPSDPVVNKYIASGLNREVVPLAVARYGDNPVKVREFVNSYMLLKEMGFLSNNVADVLYKYDNDTDKAIAHFLNNAS